MGFLTGSTKGEVQKITKNETVNVFLPTTPNPTSGFLLFIPKRDVRPLKMSVDEGIKNDYFCRNNNTKQKKQERLA